MSIPPWKSLRMLAGVVLGNLRAHRPKTSRNVGQVTKRLSSGGENGKRRSIFTKDREEIMVGKRQCVKRLKHCVASKCYIKCTTVTWGQAERSASTRRNFRQEIGLCAL